MTRTLYPSLSSSSVVWEPMYPNPPTTMMKEELVASISKGSAATSSSKSTELCVAGVLTISGVADGDTENVDEQADMVCNKPFLLNE